MALGPRAVSRAVNEENSSRVRVFSCSLGTGLARIGLFARDFAPQCTLCIALGTDCQFGYPASASALEKRHFCASHRMSSDVVSLVFGLQNGGVGTVREQACSVMRF